MYIDFDKKGRDLILGFMNHFFKDKDQWISAKQPLQLHHDISYFIEQIKELDYKESYKILTKKLKELNCKITKGTHSNLYRFGNQFELLGEYENINYYGRGPIENEVDRKQAAFVGNYTSSVKNFLNMYARPQYSGNRTDIRWFEITNKDGFGIKVEGDSLINFSASHFSQIDLDSGPIKNNSQRHGKLLIPREEIHLNIDGFIMGVGCIDSWKSLPREEYLLPYQNYQFGYTIKPIKN